MPSPDEVLHRVFGFADFRAGQREIVDAILAGEDVLAVMPTGSGKSLCYQLPAIVRGGLTVVVSPLIALMRNQVTQLRGLGVAAASFNSHNDAAENRAAYEGLREGSLRLLYVSPERLATNGTVEMLKTAGARLLAVDEAHCVSQWGHDFREDYLTLGDARERLGGIQTVAFTATADAATRADIAARLFPAEPHVVVHGFDRPNLFLGIAPKDDPTRQVVDFVARHKGESGIVYCSSRKKTEKFAEKLRERGVAALAYHAGMEAADRSRNQDAFLREDGAVMVATVAFGMGIDKPDVRFVCHADMPKDVESYYQEIGRAGRDGLPADTLALYGLDDMRLRRLQIEDGELSDDRKRVQRQRLNALIALCEAPRCRRQTLLAYFAETLPEPCGNCDLCRDGVELVDGTLEAQKALSAVVRTGERFGTEHLLNILVGEKTDAVERFGHDRLKTFGVGADRDKATWRTIFRQLYALGLLSLEIEEYGRWTVTEAGWRVLKGEETVSIRRDLAPKTRRSPRDRKGAASSATQALDAGVDGALLAALKQLRRSLAEAQGMPAFMVFPDRTLIEIARARPRTMDELSHVHGVGEAKLARYGSAFLAAVTATM